MKFVLQENGKLSFRNGGSWRYEKRDFQVICDVVVFPLIFVETNNGYWLLVICFCEEG